MRNIFLLFIVSMFFSCGQKKMQIASFSETGVGVYAADELNKYLGQMYSGVEFETCGANPDAVIQLLLTEQARDLGIENTPTKKESFTIIQNDGKLLIISPDERGLLNATYALLEKLGCNFTLSGDILPELSEWKNFEAWEMEDSPLTDDRFLFNWHNFLSGCTGWNLGEWQQWFDQTNKMRYNGIMVHAYGNNPMFSFEYLGEKKQTGYLNNTASGRDWGNQHVNDVRRLVAGEIFDAAVFGAETSMASEENKEKEATQLMQQVFQYAEERGTKVIFALDFDTWMANPRNIIEKLPKEAVFELIGGHLTPNPDHPEGYNYFKQVLKSLIEMYPQIDQLSVWHRRPGTTASLGSIWMSFPFEKFPENWKLEYKQKLKEHPEIEDNLMASGTFAYGKLIAALQKARDEIKPELEITSGSWRFQYIPYADAMYPKNVPLLPLDWEVVFDSPESVKILTDASKNRKMYPIVWAHHDDHRYIGKPYTPWENFADKLKERNFSGFGIIHWTTHPLDLYFSNTAKQVWETTQNENIRTTVENLVKARFGEQHKLMEYYFAWLTDGPMFGRETSDHFVDLGRQSLGHEMESWSGMKEKAMKRLELLSTVSEDQNEEYLRYQKTMEEFYISFFENQEKFVQAFQFLKDEKPEKAVEILETANPDESIQKYADAIKNIGFTHGEKALVFSMNTRWKADFINLQQQLGMEVVRFKFAPTQHDSLAQSPGHFSYFINAKGEWWRCLWKHELKEENFVETPNETALEISNTFNFELKSIHGQTLPAGEYVLNIGFSGENTTVKIQVIENGKVISSPNDEGFKIKSETGKMVLSISVENENNRVKEIELIKI